MQPTKTHEMLSLHDQQSWRSGVSPRFFWWILKPSLKVPSQELLHPEQLSYWTMKMRKAPTFNFTNTPIKEIDVLVHLNTF